MGLPNCSAGFLMKLAVRPAKPPNFLFGRRVVRGAVPSWRVVRGAVPSWRVVRGAVPGAVPSGPASKRRPKPVTSKRQTQSTQHTRL